MATGSLLLTKGREKIARSCSAVEVAAAATAAAAALGPVAPLVGEDEEARPLLGGERARERASPSAPAAAAAASVWLLPMSPVGTAPGRVGDDACSCDAGREEYEEAPGPFTAPAAAGARLGAVEDEGTGVVGGAEGPPKGSGNPCVESCDRVTSYLRRDMCQRQYIRTCECPERQYTLHRAHAIDSCRFVPIMMVLQPPDAQHSSHT